MEVFHGGGRGRVWGWYHGCGARPVKISSQARISASPAARQREEIAADRVVRGGGCSRVSRLTVGRVGAGGEQAVDEAEGGGGRVGWKVRFSRGGREF